MTFIFLLFAFMSLISHVYSFKPLTMNKRTKYIALKLKATQTIVHETKVHEQNQITLKRANNLPDGSYDYNQWSKAFVSQPIEMNYEVTEIEGRIPLGFEGILYRNMPALFERGNVSYGHYLDGDGCVTKLTIKGKKVNFMSKYVKTEAYINENKQQKILYRNTFRTQRPISLDPIFNKICLNKMQCFGSPQLPGSAGYRLLHPRLLCMIYAGSADRFAGLLHPNPVFNKGLVGKLRL